MSIIGLILIIIVLIIIVSVIAFAIRIVPQSKAYVVERIGAYNRTCSVGLHILVPFLDRVANKVSLKEQVVDFAPQPVITKDNVTMQIDTVVYYQITDPRLFTYGVDRPINAIENLTATTLRNIIGDLELDETLTSRDIINSRMRSILDEATDPWGIKVHRVEVKNIIPPRDIQEAMEKQMRAERERREAILQAEGKKTAAILNAEGDKQSTILRAEAEKEAAIAKAEGQAEALRLVYEAQAKGITYINDAHPNQAYVTLQGFKALENLSKGDATKIIIPSELQGIAGLATTLKEVVSEKKDNGKFKITRKGYRHLWFEQYHRQIPQLSACTTLYGKDQRRKWWLWCHHQHVRLYGVTPRYPDLRNGDHLLPFCQQGRRKLRKGLSHGIEHGGLHFPTLHRPGIPLHHAFERCDGLRRPSGLCMDHVRNRGY